MKAGLLQRLKRLEEVQATENLPPVEFQVGFVKNLPAECTGDRHLVTVGRDPDGLHQWEERPGPEPNAQNPGAEGACSTSRMRS